MLLIAQLCEVHINFVPVCSQFVDKLSVGYFLSGYIMLLSVQGLIVYFEYGTTTTDVYMMCMFMFMIYGQSCLTSILGQSVNKLHPNHDSFQEETEEEDKTK